MLIEKKEKNSSAKFYYPSCRSNNCDGVLKIKINNNDFSLDYECEKNKSHNGKKVYFKTFERFYLKEISADKCHKCNSPLENYIKYQCKFCEQYYCLSCFIFDEHINKNINNLIIMSTKCPTHKGNFAHFCDYCKEYLCNFCLKDATNMHKGHDIKNIYELMPSKVQIENLKNRIKEYDELIMNIDLWLDELTRKVERLKKNLLDEKELFTKLIDNFNQFFVNYSYFSNFHYLNEYSKNFNNEYLDKFSKCFTFREKTKILMKLFISECKPKSSVNIHKNYYLKNYYSIDKGIIMKIKDNYFFEYTPKYDEINIMTYDKNKDILTKLEKTKISFKSKIYSVSLYDNKISNLYYTIYACLGHEKKVVIFNLDLNTGIMKQSKDRLIKYENGHFKKCIQLSSELIATADDYCINLWIKNKKSDNGFSSLKELKLGTGVSDILSLNSEFFISSHYFSEKIIFYDIKIIAKEKTISKIDCLDTINSLFLFNDYIIVNCKGGMALICIKTRELIQYIQNFSETFHDKELYLNIDKNILFILHKVESDDEDDSEDSEENENEDSNYINIYVVKYNDGCFQIMDIYDKIDKKNDNLHLMCIHNSNNKDILLWGKKVYLLKKSD